MSSALLLSVLNALRRRFLYDVMRCTSSYMLQHDVPVEAARAFTASSRDYVENKATVYDIMNNSSTFNVSELIEN